MEVITIDSQAYKELVSKINAIAKFVVDHQDDDTVNPDEMWVDSYEVCTFLKISERTLQRLRSNRLISYSIISGKSYYTCVFPSDRVLRQIWCKIKVLKSLNK